MSAVFAVHGFIYASPHVIGFLAGEFGLRAGLVTLSFLALAAASTAYLARATDP